MKLYSYISNNGITVKDINNTKLFQKDINFNIQEMFFIHENKEILLCGDKKISLIDIKSGITLFTKHTNKEILECKVSDRLSIDYLLYTTGDKYERESPQSKAHIINLKKQQEVSFEKKLNNLYSSNFIYNTNVFYTVNQDYSIDLWFFTSGNKYKTLRGYYTPVNSIIFRVGKRVSSIAEDDFIKNWSLSKSKALFYINDTGNFNIHLSAFISRDSKYIIESSGDGTKIFDIYKNKSILNKVLYNPNKTNLIIDAKERKFKEGYNQSIFKINKDYIYGYQRYNKNESSINIFNFQGKFISNKYDIKDKITYVDFAYLSDMLVVSSLDSFSLWNINGDKICTLKAENKEFFSSVKFIPNTDNIITSNINTSTTNRIKIYDKTCKVIKKYKLPFEFDIQDVIYIQNTNKIIMLNKKKHKKNEVILFDMENNSFEKLYKGGFNFGENIALNQKGNLLAVVENKSIKLFDIEGRELVTIESEKSISSIQFSSDNKYLLIYSFDGVRLYPISSKEIINIVNKNTTLGRIRQLSSKERKLFNIELRSKED